MKYLGGKSKIAKEIGLILNNLLDKHKPVAYLEPFVGAGWMIKEINYHTRIGSDLSHDVVLLLSAVANGWIPPDNISEEEYKEYKKQQYPSKERGFVGFGCSWGGKWFGGFARGKTSSGEPRNYAAESKTSLIKKAKNFSAINWHHKSYLDWHPENYLIYCDPPYFGTTEYKDKFDHSVFWEWVRLVSKNNIVLVSEFTAPNDFRVIWEKTKLTDLGSSDKSKVTVTEKLFTLNSL
jgi:DNA adenine methylase